MNDVYPSHLTRTFDIRYVLVQEILTFTLMLFALYEITHMVNSTDFYYVFNTIYTLNASHE